MWLLKISNLLQPTQPKLKFPIEPKLFRYQNKNPIFFH